MPQRRPESGFPEPRSQSLAWASSHPARGLAASGQVDDPLHAVPTSGRLEDHRENYPGIRRVCDRASPLFIQYVVCHCKPKITNSLIVRLKMAMFKSNEDQAVMPGRQLAITEVD